MQRIVRLENWQIIPDFRCLGISGEKSGKKILAGNAANHPNHPDGTFVYTSVIVDQDGDTVITMSGTTYKLGKAAQVSGECSCPALAEAQANAKRAAFASPRNYEALKDLGATWPDA